MDFYQGPITSIHALSPRFDEAVLRRVEEGVEERPAALVLPMLYEEMQNEALPGIVRALSRCRFLRETVVALTAENEKQVDDVARFFNEHGFPARILWCESPAVQQELEGLKDRGLDLTHFSGKGIAVWMALGVASLDNYAVAVHDADIDDYDERILSRLLFPVVGPDLDFYYSKGYYARVTADRLYGRATRLFLWPLLEALRILTDGKSDLTEYMRSFRYPLSGEFAITSDLALNVRIPTDWGLEVGLLGEVYRNTSPKRVCQMDLGIFSHKHQPLGTDATSGLGKMVHDITSTILRTITENEGTAFDQGRLLSLRVLYRRLAQDSVRKFYVDAIANGYAYDRHEEEHAIETFSRVIEEAGGSYLGEPGREQVPDWLRTLSADPELREKLQAACLETRALEAGAAP